MVEKVGRLRKLEAEEEVGTRRRSEEIVRSTGFRDTQRGIILKAHPVFEIERS